MRTTPRGAGEQGATLIEYALLLALIVVVAVGSVMLLGSSVSNQTNGVGNYFSPTTLSSGNNGSNGNNGNNNGNGNRANGGGNGNGGQGQGNGNGNIP